MSEPSSANALLAAASVYKKKEQINPRIVIMSLDQLDAKIKYQETCSELYSWAQNIGKE